jgi:hypothetical protein
MFSIEFTEEPLMRVDLEKNERVGLLALGHHEERFVVHIGPWSTRQYVVHWRSALIRALKGQPSALVTDMQTPIQSSHLVWWPMWRVNSEIVFHNQLFFFAKHRIEGSHIDVKRLYECIGNRFPHNDEGTPVSEWNVPVSEVKRFIDSAKNVWPPHHPRHR